MSKDFKHILLASLGAFSSLASANFVNAETKADSTIKNESTNKAADNKVTPVKPTNKPKNENLKGEKGKSSSLANILKILLSLLGGAMVGGFAKHTYDKLYGLSLEKYTIDNLLWQNIFLTYGYYNVYNAKNGLSSGIELTQQQPLVLVSNNIGCLATSHQQFERKEGKFYSFYSSLRALMDNILSAKEFKNLNFKIKEDENKKLTVETRVLSSIISHLGIPRFKKPELGGACWLFDCPDKKIALDMKAGDYKCEGNIEDDGDGEQKKVFKYEATFNMSADRKLSLKEFKVIQ